MWGRRNCIIIEIEQSEQVLIPDEAIGRINWGNSLLWWSLRIVCGKQASMFHIIIKRCKHIFLLLKLRQGTFIFGWFWWLLWTEDDKGETNLTLFSVFSVPSHQTKEQLFPQAEKKTDQDWFYYSSNLDNSHSNRLTGILLIIERDQYYISFSIS